MLEEEWYLGILGGRKGGGCGIRSPKKFLDIRHKAWNIEKTETGKLGRGGTPSSKNKKNHLEMPDLGMLHRRTSSGRAIAGPAMGTSCVPWVYIPQGYYARLLFVVLGGAKRILCRYCVMIMTPQ